MKRKILIVLLIAAKLCMTGCYAEQEEEKKNTNSWESWEEETIITEKILEEKIIY